MSSPSTITVTISMSLWGCMPKPRPGAILSSLITRSGPNPIQAGSAWEAKEKVCQLSSQSSRVWKRSAAGRTSRPGVVEG